MSFETVDSSAVVSSTVACREGKLDGDTGTVKYFRKNGRQFWEARYSPERGVRYVAGIKTAHPDVMGAQFEFGPSLFGGEPSCGSRSVLVNVLPATALEESVVVDSLISLSKNWYASKCTRSTAVEFYMRADTVVKKRDSMSIYFGTYVSVKRGEVENYFAGRTSEYWRNHERREIDAQADRERQALMTKQRAAEQRQRDSVAAKETAAALSKQREKASRRAAIEKEFGKFRPSRLSDVAPNPSAMKGQVIGFCAGFRQMLNESMALVMGDQGLSAAITNVPKTRFRRTDAVAYFVAKVTGQEQGLTVLRYVTAVDQRDGYCSDYVDLPWDGKGR